MIITAVTVSLTIISVAAIALLLARTSEVRALKRKNSDLSNTAHDLRVKRNHDRRFIESIHHRNVTLVKHVENMSRRLECYEGRVAPLDYAEALEIDGKRLVQSVRECCTQLPDKAQRAFDMAKGYQGEIK